MTTEFFIRITSGEYAGMFVGAAVGNAHLHHWRDLDAVLQRPNDVVWILHKTKDRCPSFPGGNLPLVDIGKLAGAESRVVDVGVVGTPRNIQGMLSDLGIESELIPATVERVSS